MAARLISETTDDFTVESWSPFSIPNTKIITLPKSIYTYIVVKTQTDKK